jgi:hypothetical protein
LSCGGKKLSPIETPILTYEMDFYGNEIPNITKFQTRKENKNHQISIRGSNHFFVLVNFHTLLTKTNQVQLK